LVEVVDQPLVMVDDLLDAEPSRRLGGLAHLLDVAVLAWPLGRGNGKAALGEILGVVLPAARREPSAVNQDQRDPVAVGVGRVSHAVLLVRIPTATLRQRTPRKKSNP
jgi:hypothetical protein